MNSTVYKDFDEFDKFDVHQPNINVLDELSWSTCSSAQRSAYQGKRIGVTSKVIKRYLMYCDVKLRDSMRKPLHPERKERGFDMRVYDEVLDDIGDNDDFM